MSGTLNKYKVWLRSTPGFYEQYNGSVTVFAEDEYQAVEQALDKLRRGEFRDRNRSMWKVEKVERSST